MRRLVAVITFAAALLGAPLQAGADSASRPIEGRLDQTTVAVGTSVTSSGTSVVSHLGRGSGEADFTISFGANQLLLSGTGVLIAANGDRLETTFTGTADLLTGVGSTGSFTLLSTITGGTGRFSDASGSFVTRGTNTVLSVGSQVVVRSVSTLDGRISY
jgi:hypothetical protein